MHYDGASAFDNDAAESGRSGAGDDRGEEIHERGYIEEGQPEPAAPRSPPRIRHLAGLAPSATAPRASRICDAKDTMAEGVAAPMGLTEGAAYSTQERVWIQGCVMARVLSALRGERRRADARRIQSPVRLAARLVGVEERAESDVEVQGIALTGRVKSARSPSSPVGLPSHIHLSCTFGDDERRRLPQLAGRNGVTADGFGYEGAGPACCGSATTTGE
ncbi:hypothetical protein B0H17DRAFT_1218300 [Mycena rosella]|uniref:Uncharacterized protein n=1 Tax=Mycena rosella TaxID=1033263 RepID=A0AAD7BR44_MYCRO|nr:hypothetical protein B0H17DRAFT_1218300 [Mycena rosella]